jgi:hypothetical protein
MMCPRKQYRENKLEIDNMSFEAVHPTSISDQLLTGIKQLKKKLKKG